MSEFKPLLAATLKDANKLRFPLIASPKLDGIRCIVRDGVALTRKLKPVPNKWVQERLRDYQNLDGELMVEGADYNGVQSAIMSVEGRPDFTYHVFDTTDDHRPYHKRLRSLIGADLPAPYKVLGHKWVRSLEEVFVLEKAAVFQGYEGLMLRDPEGRYKHGRSTEREGILLKMKRFEDAEAEVIGFEERMHNGNELQRDELGHAKRSSAVSGLVGRGDLGALVVRYTGSGVVFQVGSGFTDAQRREIWDNQSAYLGKMATVKYQEFSALGVPRFPVFKGFRGD